MRSNRSAKPVPPAPGSNLAGRDTALLEALWRGDELAAALRAAEAALAARERDLSRAQETIAELSDIADAVQAALDELRARTADTGAADAEAARKYLEERDAVAAELFRIALRRGASGAGENVRTIIRRPLVLRWWRRMRRPRG